MTAHTRKVFERYLTEAEERQLFTTVKKVNDILALRDYAWMRLLRFTGLRVETLAGLTVHDARETLRSNYLQVRDEIVKGGMGGKIYASKKACQALRELLSIRRQMGYAETPDAPLIMSRNHKGISIRSIQARVSKWGIAAGLGVDVSPHWFRHTLAKRLMKKSTAADPRGVVQSVLLQNDPKATAVYTLPDREEIEQYMEEVS